jgi:hypothetical protein
MIFLRTFSSPLIGRIVKDRDYIQNPFSEYRCSKFVGPHKGEHLVE